MFSEVHWTDASEAHIARHHVDPDEVDDLLASSQALLFRGREDTQVVLGKIRSGRYLTVVVVRCRHGYEDRLDVVTARDMATHERRLHQRRRP